MKLKEIVSATFLLTVSIALNCLGSMLSERITFPLYLDSIMTIFLVFRINLPCGIICAFLTNLVLNSFSLVSLPFAVCHISTALIAWFIKEKCAAAETDPNEKKSLTFNEFLFAGFFSAISNTILGNFIALYYYKEIYMGMEEIFNSNFLAQSFYFVSKNITFSIYASGFISNMVDKIISALVSFAAYKMIDLSLKTMGRNKI